MYTQLNVDREPLIRRELYFYEKHMAMANRREKAFPIFYLAQ